MTYPNPEMHPAVDFLESGLPEPTRRFSENYVEWIIPASDCVNGPLEISAWREPGPRVGLRVPEGEWVDLTPDETRAVAAAFLAASAFTEGDDQ
jgi:hypothetical protein